MKKFLIRISICIALTVFAAHQFRSPGAGLFMLIAGAVSAFFAVPYFLSAVDSITKE